jgi:hypothetical protein
MSCLCLLPRLAAGRSWVSAVQTNCRQALSQSETRDSVLSEPIALNTQDDTCGLYRWTPACASSPPHTSCKKRQRLPFLHLLCSQYLHTRLFGDGAPGFSPPPPVSSAACKRELMLGIGTKYTVIHMPDPWPRLAGAQRRLHKVQA